MYSELVYEADFYSLINNLNYSATVVFYTASWCGPCRRIKPFTKEIALKYTNIQFLEVDIDKFEELPTVKEINNTPTFVIYQKGNITNDTVIGANRKELEKMIKKYSNTEFKSDNTQSTYCKIL